MNKKKIFKNITIIICFIFICSYIVSNSGYYEYTLKSKKDLTDYEIEKFESDIREGKSIDITNYLEDKDKDYSNKLSRFTVKLNKNINNYLNEGIDTVFNILNKLVE